jgi:hypothetical protein
LEVNWEALPVSAKDVRQKGVVKVGSRAKGPSTVTIKFPKVYRKVPSLTVSEVKEKKKIVNSNIEIPVEAFDFSVVSIDQAKAVVRISVVTEDSAENAGWKKNLQLKWTAAPADFDAKIAEEVTVREQTEVLGSNLGMFFIQIVYFSPSLRLNFRVCYYTIRCTAAFVAERHRGGLRSAVQA